MSELDAQYHGVLDAQGEEQGEEKAGQIKYQTKLQKFKIVSL